ncbi:MAG: leucine--tRNA ligase, partial [Bacteroidia bacterium]|nr:leucine--tRNA ligase [Bacteroidia bacterium]
NNIKRYREQLIKLGLSYDWDREIKTCSPDYYHWTQWAFLQMFKHWFNIKTQKAEPITGLIDEFNRSGNINIEAACNNFKLFTAQEWKNMTEKERQLTLLNYRIAYLADTMVNWCPVLGTVLANDEVKDGSSVRGGHSVEQKIMKQWCLRVTAYAERLLTGLEKVAWSDSLKEMQRNWIGKSDGADIWFKIKDNDRKMLIFTTRPDTIFGATFMVLAPESELVSVTLKPEFRDEVLKYLEETKKRTERERLSDIHRITGVFTGSYTINPFNGKEMPVWISDYVLAGYGTGAIMAVPAHDSRDFAFAKHFGLSVIPVIKPYNGEIPENQSHDTKEGIMINSGFINGMNVPDAIQKVIEEVKKQGIGQRKVNYRLRDAIFSRQRYWGEPFPIYFIEGIPYPLNENELPLTLPVIDKFQPASDGNPPLKQAKNWKTKQGHPLECSTMPGFAGSSAYYLRFMDPHNNKELVSKDSNNYWRNVDLYIGGTEHATGHLIYSRFWNKFLFDLGYICEDEPFMKLVNQGMILGRSNFVYRIKNTNTFVSYELTDKYDVTPINVDVNIVDNDFLDVEAFGSWNPDYKDSEFIFNKDGKYVCGSAIEKMSKSLHNIVNPDDIIEKYGTDTLRMYEMFLGPLEMSKPWDTNGIDGVHKFLRKYWRLFHVQENIFSVSDETPTGEELKALHKTIKKVQSDIENFSFNTSVSALMICVNELTDLKCNKRHILEKLNIILSPFAPHICEELWEKLGYSVSITKSSFPGYNEEYLVVETFEYPVSFNGKLRFKKELKLNLSSQDVEKAILQDERTLKWLDAKTPKKIIFVPGKIINIVV